MTQASAASSSAESRIGREAPAARMRTAAERASSSGARAARSASSSDRERDLEFVIADAEADKVETARHEKLQTRLQTNRLAVADTGRHEADAPKPKTPASRDNPTFRVTRRHGA